MGDAFERPALYYPYIDIRSEHWLKATLLCVPAVKRMVPEEYTPEDRPNIIEYTRIEGRNGALLQSVPAFSPAADAAQQRLETKLREHEDDIPQNFYHSQILGPGKYWIHDAKFNGSLLRYLIRKDLAWQSLDSLGAHDHGRWYALHPILGSAIMTTLGLSIAMEQKYDIVTPSTKFHEILLTTNEDAIFDVLLSSKEPSNGPTRSQASHDLGQLVITMTGVNFEALQPNAIPELQSSEHFGKFQNLIKTRAQSFELNSDPRDYKTQLKFEAEEIITAWQETKLDVSNGLKDALFDAGSIVAEPVLKSMFRTPDVTDLFIAGGLAVVLLTCRGMRLAENRQKSGPTQYLSEIIEGQSNVLRMTFPLGLER